MNPGHSKYYEQKNWEKERDPPTKKYQNIQLGIKLKAKTKIKENDQK